MVLCDQKEICDNCAYEIWIEETYNESKTPRKGHK